MRESCFMLCYCSQSIFLTALGRPCGPEARDSLGSLPIDLAAARSRLRRPRIPGDHRQLAIPVPIPNTVVKQLSPMIVLMRESRLSPGSPKAPLVHTSGAFFYPSILADEEAYLARALIDSSVWGGGMYRTWMTL